MNDNPKILWDRCMQHLKSQVPEQQFQTWFSSVDFDSYEGHKLTLLMPNQFVIEYIESHFSEQFTASLNAAFGANWQLAYRLKSDAAQSQKPAEKPDNAPVPIDAHLNANFTMENFLEGSSNKLARTVGLSIAKSPGKLTFNPFFVYGNSGVGKTHLINAIGLKTLQLYPSKRVLYVPAHVFKVQYSEAVVNNKLNDFIHFYQSIDVLIIDDIQEFTTAKTQQAFFHIFNHLHLNERQIIISSDKEPSKFEGIEERMLTRFNSGITVEIERPDIALRRAVIQAKLRRDGLRFPKEVVDFIVNNVDSSVRELQGIINSLMAYSVVDDCSINLELAQRVVARAVNLEKRELSFDSILRQVCRAQDIKVSDVLATSRKQQIVQTRQLAMYLVHKYTQMSYAEIGRKMGKKDHTTVLHACDVIQKRLATDKQFRKNVEDIEVSLKK